MLGIANQMGMETVAEGIETAEVLSMLQKLECNLGQGYFFSKPVSGPDALQMVAKEGVMEQAAVNAENCLECVSY